MEQRGVFEAVEHLRAAAGVQHATRPVARIGSVKAGTVPLLFPTIIGFQKANPGSTVEVRNLQQLDIEAGLEDGTLDIGLLNLLDGDDLPPHLESTILLCGQPVAVLPADHGLAGRPSVTPDDLRDEPFVAMRTGYIMNRYAHRLFGSSLPDEWHVTDGAEMGTMMVAEGLGICVLPDYSVTGDPLERAGLIVSRPIDAPPTSVTMVAVHARRAKVPAVVNELRTILTETARTMPSGQSSSRAWAAVGP